MTEVEISSKEVYEMVYNQLVKKHNLKVKNLKSFTINGNFAGYEAKIETVDTPLVLEDNENKSDKIII